MNNADFYKKFGESGITRLMFLYSFKYPIDMDYVSDSNMEILATSVENYIRCKYSKEADILFAIWSDSYNKILYSDMYNQEAWSEYLLLLEKTAIGMGGIVLANDKKFGVSGITRDAFKNYFDPPIDMSEVSDKDMVSIAISVESHMRKEYPDMITKLFAIWVNNDTPDEVYDDVITYKQGKMLSDYWNTLKELAIKAGGVVCETADDDDDDDIDQTAIATGSIISDKNLMIQIDAIDRKLADLAYEFNRLKETIGFLYNQK